MLPKNEGSSARSAALLRVRIGKQCALFGNPINVRSVITHDAMIVGTDVMNPNVIPPKNENVQLLATLSGVG